MYLLSVSSVMVKSLLCVLLLVLLVILVSETLSVKLCRQKKPHIVIMLADDMGWNDVGLHGSAQIPTPNIDALGYNGQVLHRHYTMHICTPSRTALLTAKYPIRLGMQGTPLNPAEERKISEQVKFLPSRMKELNYKTHLVGKWHMGHYNISITPNGRGFDTAYGYYNGFVGYYDYVISQEGLGYGYDLHRDNHPDLKNLGKYATEVFTEEAVNIINAHKECDPLFLMVSHLAVHTGKNGTELETLNDTAANERFSYIEEPERRLYAGMLSELDVSVGKVVNVLARKKMLKNSIILFLSDNGGQTVDPILGYANFASNWPQRGMKFTLNEGGVRNVGLIWSPLLKRKKFVNKNVIHLTDWMPTLYAAAGGDPNKLGDIDGKNLWPMFTSSNNVPPFRNSILLNIDEVLEYGGILSGDGRWKLLNGTFPLSEYDVYLGDSGRGPKDPQYNVQSVLNSDVNQAILSLKPNQPLTKEDISRIRNDNVIIEGPGPRNNTCRTQCLYDLWMDPTEKIDVKDQNLIVYYDLMRKLNTYRQELMPQLNKNSDPRGDPKHCNNVWFTWEEATNPECAPEYAAPI